MNEDTSATELATEEQVVTWCGRFAAYRQPPTRATILEWLSRFDPQHLNIAHRILDSVQIVSEIEIHQGYRQALDGLPGWSKKRAERSGRWFFVGAGGAGESGPAMLRMFREANGLTSDGWQRYFVSMRELPALNLSAFDQVVFIDDFAGSGDQMVGFWPTMQELVASEAHCYLLLTAVTYIAAQRIRDETELDLRPTVQLPIEANIFSDECQSFTQDEKLVIENYGRIAWPSFPRGFGECGLTLILSHKTPNNTIPILHINSDRWVGPFPRNLLKAA